MTQKFNCWVRLQENPTLGSVTYGKGHEKAVCNVTVQSSHYTKKNKPETTTLQLTFWGDFAEQFVATFHSDNFQPGQLMNISGYNDYRHSTNNHRAYRNKVVTSVWAKQKDGTVIQLYKQ